MGLGMTTATLSTKNNFDLIRLAAAFQVAGLHTLFHFNVGEWSWWYIQLLPGVPVFFFVSGFLVFPSLQRSASLGQFFWNRALRIYPALWACFFATMVWVLWIGVLPLSEVNTKAFFDFARSQVTFWQYEGLVALQGFGTGNVNGSLWTITVELQFYLLAPVLALIVKQHKAMWFFVIVALAWANTQLNSLPHTSPITTAVHVSFLPWFYMFAFGAWLSTRPDIVAKILRLPFWVLMPALFVVQITLYKFGYGYSANTLSPPVFVLMAFLILKLAYTKPDLAKRLLNGNDISYGVYIYHMPVVNTFLYFGLVERFRWVALALLATLSLAAFSWFLIEKPALSLKKRWKTPMTEQSPSAVGPTTDSAYDRPTGSAYRLNNYGRAGR